jgi:hypothetical protein
LVFASLLLFILPCKALDRSWDGPAQQSDVVEGGSGVWNLILENWFGIPGFPLQTPTNTTYRGGDRVIFGGEAGSVYVGANLTGGNAAANMHFTAGGYIFTLPAGNDLRVNGGITSTGASQPLFTLDAGDQTMTIAGTSTNSGQALIIDSECSNLNTPHHLFARSAAPRQSI